jgi:DNA-binding NtrC family response regulator
MSGGDPDPHPEALIVEDEAMTRMDAADAIGDAGITTHEAADATEALQAIQDHPGINLLFTDINMPGEMDGMALAKEVCEADPDMNLIVTSGAVDLDDEQLPDSGTFLRKPYTQQRLLQIIRKKLTEKP